MRLQLSGFARHSRRIINIAMLLVSIVLFYVLHPGLTWKDLRYGLTVAGFVAAFDITFRVLIKWKYGTSPTAKRLSHVITVADWIAFLVIVSVYS